MSPPYATGRKVFNLRPLHESEDIALVDKIKRRGILPHLECVLYCAVQREKQKRRQRPQPQQVSSL